MFHSRFCLTYIQGGFRNAALQEVLKELMATKQQPPVDLDSKYISEQGDPVDDQQDGPARYALYDTRLSAMLANKQEIDSDLPRIIAEEQNDKVPSGVGVTYTRLGSDKCRSGAELVYEGVVAGYVSSIDVATIHSLSKFVCYNNIIWFGSVFKKLSEVVFGPL